MNSPHRNLFDPLRILFAVMVIVSHSVALSGAGTADWLARQTGGQTNFSYLGVRGFFVISGFLVYRSLLRSRHLRDFLQKRLLRIFPGLVVMLLVITFAAGPLLTAFSLPEYFRGAWRYPLSELRVFPVARTESLPGVFTANPEGSAVNGSLWTIWFELLFYIGLALLILLRSRRRLLQGVVVGGWAGLLLFFIFFRHLLDGIIFPFTGMSSEVALDLLLYFTAGAALSGLPWAASGRLRLLALGLGLLLFGAGIWGGFFLWSRYLALPLIVLGAGNSYWAPLAAVRKAGEPSYGIYIYAYPVQQALVQLLAPDSLALTLLTIPIAGVLGYASWHLVEKRALRMKPRG